VARSPPLESAGRLRDLLRHGRIGLFHRLRPWWLPPSRATASEKKADVVEHAGVFDHVGLLINKPPGSAGLLFI
jgi:hypothetical protein